MFKYHHTGIRLSPYEFEGDPTFPGISVGKESASNAEDKGRCEFDTQVRKIPWRREWQPTLVFLPGESHDQRIWWTTVHEVTQLDMTEVTQQAHMHTSSNRPHGGSIQCPFSSSLVAFLMLVSFTLPWQPISMPAAQTESSVTALLPSPNSRYYTCILFCFYTVILQTHCSSSHCSYLIFDMKISLIYPHSFPFLLTHSPSSCPITIFALSLLLSSLHYFSSFHFFQPDHNSHSVEKIRITNYEQMSISVHHKTSRFKRTSVLILYLPCCMKCPCFAKTIVSSFVPDFILFTSYGLHSCSDPLCLPSTRPCSTALQCAS